MANVLCVNIGRNHIKSGVLPHRATLNDLARARLRRVQSLGWMNSSLPRILSSSYRHSLLALDHKLPAFDLVRVGIASPVYDDGKIGQPDLVRNGVPEDLKGALQEQVGVPVEVINDTEAWLLGAVHFAQLIRMPVLHPVFCLAFGAAVGFATMRDSRVKPRELQYENMDFSELFQIAGPYKMVHEAVGDDFFRWVKQERPQWTILDVRREYTRRVAAMLHGIETKFDGIGTLFIGGGHAEFLTISDLEKDPHVHARHIVPLRDSDLEIDAGLVPLLGLSQS